MIEALHVSQILPHFSGHVQSGPAVCPSPVSHEAHELFRRPLKEVRDWCFTGCGFAAVDLSSTVLEKRGGRAFASCGRLSEVKFPSTLKEVGDWCFSGCGFAAVDLSSTMVKSVGVGAFYACRRLRFAILPCLPCRLATIGPGCFGCTGVVMITWMRPSEVWKSRLTSTGGRAAIEVGRPSSSVPAGWCAGAWGSRGPFDECDELEEVVPPRLGGEEPVSFGSRVRLRTLEMFPETLPMVEWHSLLHLSRVVLRGACTLSDLEEGGIPAVGVLPGRLGLRRAGRHSQAGSVLPECVLAFSGGAGFAALQARPLLPVA